jgi:NitT/TauT family transport system ATP-binding protein
MKAVAVQAGDGTQSEADRPQHGVSIEIDGVSKEYRSSAGESIHALDRIDTRIGAGEFVSVVGPSGCGKSTLLMLIAGLYPVTTGSVRLDGETVTRPHPKTGVIFQRDLLLSWRTVLDNVLLPVEIKRWSRKHYRDRAETLLDQVGLAGFGRKYPDELSGGMRQRVAICRALIQAPGLLLMDEPFGALDALTREQIGFDVLRMWEDIGNTVFFITHSIDEAVLMADRVLVMSPRPGRVERDITIDLPRPRTGDTHADRRFVAHTTEIRRIFERQGVLKTH